jgi:precorrin-6B methylase 2
MANPAEGYESYMVPTLFGPCARILIQEADPKPGERVLDVGCGAGIVAREVASHLGATATVTALI